MKLRFSSEAKYLSLLVSLVLLLVLGSLFEGRTGGQLVIAILFSLILVSALGSITESRRRVIVAAVAVLIALAGRWLAYTAGSAGGHIVGSATTIVFLSYTVVVILNDVLRGGRITNDKVIGAICVYLLLGVIWASLYTIVDLASTEQAFRGAVGVAGPDGGLGFSNLLYFSFVTLTTLGYGDIVPVSSIARTLSILEGITGPLYLAVLIARLVGLHIAHSSQDDG